MKKYIISNCPASSKSYAPDGSYNQYCFEGIKKCLCEDRPDCLLKRIVEKLKPLQIITFEHGIRGMFNAEAKVELKQVSKIFDMLEIEEVQMSKDCTTCKNAFIKDFAFLICSINGLLDLKDVENSKNCKYYEECENE